MTALQLGTKPCTCSLGFHETRLVAITGGPGGGKTAILELALRSFCGHVGALPEAAGIVFGGGFPRRASDAGRRAAQRAIFYIQREVEGLMIDEGDVAVALCDRGTLDGVAYWPGSPESYWDAFRTTRQQELDRYAAVIHLRTPPAHQGYNRVNPLRIESAVQARAIDERILAAWDGHPRRAVIDSEDDFVAKATRALEEIRSTLPSCCQEHGLSTEQAIGT